MEMMIGIIDVIEIADARTFERALLSGRCCRSDLRRRRAQTTSSTISRYAACAARSRAAENRPGSWSYAVHPARLVISDAGHNVAVCELQDLVDGRDRELKCIAGLPTSALVGAQGEPVGGDQELPRIETLGATGTELDDVVRLDRGLIREPKCEVPSQLADRAWPFVYRDQVITLCFDSALKMRRLGTAAWTWVNRHEDVRLFGGPNGKRVAYREVLVCLTPTRQRVVDASQRIPIIAFLTVCAGSITPRKRIDGNNVLARRDERTKLFQIDDGLLEGTPCLVEPGTVRVEVRRIRRNPCDKLVGLPAEHIGRQESWMGRRVAELSRQRRAHSRRRARR